MRRRVTSVVGLTAVYGLVAFAPFLAPYDPTAQHRDAPFAPPTAVHIVDHDTRTFVRPFVYGLARDGESGYVEDRRRVYPLRFLSRPADGSSIRLFTVDDPGQIFLAGTDRFGRDRFSRILYGGRVSLTAGLFAAALSLLLGMTGGIVAGLIGGWTDRAVLAASDVFLAVPWLYLLLAVRAALPINVDPFRALAVVVIVIGVAGWARPARLVRGVVMSAKNRDFILAARASGASSPHIVRAHILPQTLGVLLPQASILVPQFALAEITLSFFGLGVSEPAPSWGTLMRELIAQPLAQAKWWTAAPALVLAVVFVMHQVLADDLQARTVQPAMEGLA